MLGLICRIGKIKPEFYQDFSELCLANPVHSFKIHPITFSYSLITRSLIVFDNFFKFHTMFSFYRFMSHCVCERLFDVGWIELNFTTRRMKLWILLLVFLAILSAVVESKKKSKSKRRHSSSEVFYPQLFPALSPSYWDICRLFIVITCLKLF